MAQRKTSRQKQAPSRVRAGAGASERRDPDSIEGWRQECERLKAELKVSRDEIANLRSRQEQVLNRIEWVLDSLDTLSEDDS